ncbi:methyltransferase [Candidatus Cytomitobacter indipagum]|uniref:Methyltransferase n=1 Tax=Candidatus Cytomitobacter indipagum TaxID=2601575 RepID=A0A5C0UE15_9PROT|nr:rRNA adenine N-6-methyltransferase family protein [Candidatus Cytomitobacter indipagum]QEK37947.1 methyltransferase [Candidatus Cytomitobacter indipagum]
MAIFNKENIKFAKSWIKNPKRMGTFLPLSSKVGKKMIHSMPKVSDNGLILEIGSGSGALTEFISSSNNADKIICVEIDEELCKILQKKFPKAIIHNKSASKFNEYIPNDILNNVEVIISSIPFMSVGKTITKEIITSCVDVLKSNNGVIIHVAYTPFVPFASYGMKKVFCKSVWGIPMTYIHCYKAI